MTTLSRVKHFTNLETQADIVPSSFYLFTCVFVYFGLFLMYLFLGFNIVPLPLESNLERTHMCLSEHLH